MSRLQIYGTAMSRAIRTLWMAEELGIDYEHVPVRLDNGENRKPEYLAVNPSGQVPAIRDGDLVLAESLAINLYLAQKFGGGLWFDRPDNQARALQWSFWAATQVEEPLIAVLLHKVRLPEAERDATLLAKAEQRLANPLKRLDDALAKQACLVGDGFSVADLNVAGVLFLARPAQFDLAPWPNVTAWFARCLARPAAKAALAKRQG